MGHDLNPTQHDVNIITTSTYIEWDVPIVTTALKSPLAIRSISFSICCSVDEGELRIAYDEWGRGGDPGWEVAVGCGGSKENREGEGAINDKY